MSDPIVQFDGVTKHYPQYHHVTAGLKNLLFNLPQAVRAMLNGRFTALDDVSFSIGRGECVGIIGHNGAGKSTTLGLIAGVLRPNAGRVTVGCRVSPLLELGAGFHAELSGRDNILLNGVLLGLSRRAIREKLDEIVDFAELEKVIDQPVRTYSSGMLARLGFSVVSRLEPQLLLIDEVLAVGDLRFREKCRRTLDEFRAQGVTVILVTHSHAEVHDFCDRAIWLDRGKVRADGPPEVITSMYQQEYSQAAA